MFVTERYLIRLISQAILGAISAVFSWRRYVTVYQKVYFVSSWFLRLFHIHISSIFRTTYYYNYNIFEIFSRALADGLSLESEWQQVTSGLYDMVFHWNLSDSKSPQVFRTFLSILAVLNNAVVWIVSTRPPTSKSSSPFSNPLVTVPNAPITIGIIVTCMFHSFFNSLARSRYLSFYYYYYYYYYFTPF